MEVLLVLSGVATIVMVALYRLIKVKGALHRMFLSLAGFFGVIMLAVLFRNIHFLLLEMFFVVVIFVDFKLEKKLRNNIR